MKPVFLRDAAASDLRDAFGWYQARRVGLGEEFLQAARSTLASIEEASR
jgi:plasmid stabilization system protein ParE